MSLLAPPLVVFGSIVTDKRWFGIEIGQWMAGMLVEP
jgi:hypothetical protein